MDFCSVFGWTIYLFIFLFDRLYRKFKLTRMRVFFFFFFFVAVVFFYQSEHK